jgi:hypothetical protein
MEPRARGMYTVGSRYQELTKEDMTVDSGMCVCVSVCVCGSYTFGSLEVATKQRLGKTWLWTVV